ncbi:cytochrome c [Litoreibacter ponti]|uniref:Cytochrome c n=1 Tax=Litoreibacter ponti TaxID=1510457 RepID=A0A2T6BFN5_9RHOB|nr:cytochrome c family protein [Litoreibacter ponti]PTX54870.1 cytochrome c [Litoreibacter ponti]
MFDTMTLTKALGAVCGSLLVFLLGSWAAETIYHGGGGHGEEKQQAYVIEVEGGDEVEEVEEEVDFAAVFETADAGKGERVFNKCRACHKLEDGANGTGPHLYGVVGREIAAVDGFGYSDTLSGKDQAWTPENLNGFLEAPREWAPGTTMGFAGLNKVEDRANLIAYLDSIGG